MAKKKTNKSASINYWPGEHDKVVRRYETNPYKLTNDRIMYGYNNKNGLGPYQRGVNESGLYSNNIASNSLSRKAIKTVKDDGLFVGTSPSSTLRNKSFNSFSKFGYLDPYNRMPGFTKEVLFFTKPDLHIYSSKKDVLYTGVANSPFFMDLADKWPEVISEMKKKKEKGKKSPFMHLLHNRVRDTLDLPDISSNDIDISANMYGNDYTYRGSSEPSDDQFTFNLEFEDNKYLDVYMLFRAYEEYERYKKLGLVMPMHRYISRKVLHDQISIFKFTLADDFSTILHYAKLWGCYPTGLPRSVFGSTDFSSSGLTLSVPWKCAFVEDMNPLILTDFNDLMSGYSNSKNKISNVLPNGRINKTDWADGAYIVQQHANPNDSNSRYVYKLEWRNK